MLSGRFSLGLKLSFSYKAEICTIFCCSIEPVATSNLNFLYCVLVCMSVCVYYTLCNRIWLFAQIKEIIWSEWTLNGCGKSKVALTFSGESKQYFYRLLTLQLQTAVIFHRRFPMKRAFFGVRSS